MDKTDTPRLFETKDGLKSVNPTQKPIEARDYFANKQLPKGMDRMNVFITEAGPIIDRQVPVEWSEKHDQLLSGVVGSARQSIADNGYYLRKTTTHLKDLAAETTASVDDVFGKFHSSFKQTFGVEPGAMVDTWRAERNLPTSSRAPSIERTQEPDLS